MHHLAGIHWGEVSSGIPYSSIRSQDNYHINVVRSLTLMSEPTAVSADQPQFLLISPCAAAAVAVGGFSFQSRCNLAALGQRRGLGLLITATVMKC